MITSSVLRLHLAARRGPAASELAGAAVDAAGPEAAHARLAAAAVSQADAGNIQAGHQRAGVDLPAGPGGESRSDLNQIDY